MLAAILIACGLENASSFPYPGFLHPTRPTIVIELELVLGILVPAHRVPCTRQKAPEVPFRQIHFGRSEDEFEFDYDCGAALHLGYKPTLSAADGAPP